MNQTPHLETLRDLLRQASDEINTFGARQFTTFREIVIVQGLIAWAFTQLRLEPGLGAQVVRYAAIAACIAAAGIGFGSCHHIANASTICGTVAATRSLGGYSPSTRL